MGMLLINGSPRKGGCTNRALEEVRLELSKNGIESEIIWLGNKPLQDCIACGSCYKTGKCAFDDDLVNEVAAKLVTADGIVIGSPVYYGGPNGRITSFMDRLCYSSGSKLDGKVAATVVSCRRGGATAAYERLNMYFGMLNCMIPASQYWNQVHGFSAEDVEKDAEGLQTMRVLADNIAYLVKNRKAGEAAGVKMPERDVHIFTNFIN